MTRPAMFPSTVRSGVTAWAVAVLVAFAPPATGAAYVPQAAGGVPVRVCVVDTGVPKGAPGVVERLTATGSLEPTEPHGAQMAAIIRTAYPQAQIVSVQRSGGPTTVTIADTVDLCVARQTQVISMSFVLTEGGYDRPALEAAVDRARAAGVVLVAAAGNRRLVEAPANVPGVIGVGAVDSDGSTCEFSPEGQGLLMAPGCDVEGTETEGTSDAAAYVAGTAAAIIGTRGIAGAAVEAAVRTVAYAEAEKRSPYAWVARARRSVTVELHEAPRGASVAVRGMRRRSAVTVRLARGAGTRLRIAVHCGLRQQVLRVRLPPVGSGRAVQVAACAASLAAVE
jgi:subtilisin family serine protease